MRVTPLVAQVIVFSFAGSTLVLAQRPPAPPLTALELVKAIHITGYDQMTGPDRDIAVCLMEKLAAKGPFTFPDAPDSADAILTWKSIWIWGALANVACGLADGLVNTFVRDIERQRKAPKQP